MSDEPDPPENPPASLIPRSAGGTPPPNRRGGASRAPQTSKSPYGSVPPPSPPPSPRPSAPPNVPPQRNSSPAHTPPARTTTTPPIPVPGSTPATSPVTGQPGSTPSQPPIPGYASSRSKAPIAAPSSLPPFDILMPTPKRPFSIPPYAGCMVKMLFGFTVLLVMGYCALVALNPKAQKWATQKNGPTPFKTVNQMLALPAQMIGKTKDVVATNDARVGVLDHVITADTKGTTGVSAKPLTDPFGKPTATAPGQSPARAAAAAGKEEDAGRISREALLAMAEKDTQEAAAPKPAPVRPVATEPPVPAGPAELKLSGGIVVTSRSPEGAPAASGPFMYWVAGVTVGGVSNTSPARFLMNSRLVREGEEVNKLLGITVDRVDSVAKLIYFRDKRGAVVTRSY